MSVTRKRRGMGCSEHRQNVVINMTETPCEGGREKEGTRADGGLEELRPKHSDRTKERKGLKYF